MMAEVYTPTMAEVLAAATYRIAGTLSEPEWSQAHAAVDRALAAHDAQVKAEAWDEGAFWALQDQGIEEYVFVRNVVRRDNPYRAAETKGGE